MDLMKIIDIISSRL